MKIDKKVFDGIIPKTEPKLLPADNGQVAENCDLFGGNLRPIRVPSTEETINSSNAETIFPHGEQWFTWDTDVNVLHTPIATDQYNRIYYTGDGVPKVQSLVDDVYTIYDLKVDNPVLKPVTAVANEGSGTSTTDAESRTYLYTLVTAWGEETLTSDASIVLEVPANSDVLINNMDVTVSSSRNVTKKRIYRSDSLGNFRFVAEIDLATASYTDAILEADLDETLSTEDFEQPDDNLRGLTSMAGGVFAAFYQNKIYFSEPFQPHAWPSAYSLSVDQDIVGMASTGNTLVVATKGAPHIVVGHHPEQFSMTKLELEQSCISKKSVTNVGDSVCYASPSGIVRIIGGQGSLITSELFTDDEWNDINPETMNCEMYDRNLILATSTHTHFLDLEGRGGGLTTVVQNMQTSMYKHTTNDILYFLDGLDIKSWDTGGQEMEARWKSGILPLEYPINWSVIRVIANSHPVTVNLYAEEELVLTFNSRDSKAVRLPPMRPEKHWSFEIVSRFDVDRLTLSTSMRDL